jgi:hypothetical protein
MTRDQLQWAINYFGDEKGVNLATQRLLEAARVHIATLPKTQTVQAWHVEYFDIKNGEMCCRVIYKYGVDGNKSVAVDEADRLKNLGFACTRVTGPHEHEVPA